MIFIRSEQKCTDDEKNSARNLENFRMKQESENFNEPLVSDAAREHVVREQLFSWPKTGFK